MDIKLKTEDAYFKFRVNGILMKDDKILVVRMCKNSFYCLPGGHVELGEDSQKGIIREMKEETGYDVIDPQLIAITENFFKGKLSNKMHEIGFYYLMKLDEKAIIEKNEYVVIEHDKDGDIELEFKWLKISELDKINFQPEFLKEKLGKMDFKLTHNIIKNE